MKLSLLPLESTAQHLLLEWSHLKVSPLVGISLHEGLSFPTNSVCRCSLSGRRALQWSNKNDEESSFNNPWPQKTLYTFGKNRETSRRNTNITTRFPQQKHWVIHKRPEWHWIVVLREPYLVHIPRIKYLSYWRHLLLIFLGHVQRLDPVQLGMNICSI